MSLSKILKIAEKYAADNSPAILAGVAVVGVGAVAYLSAKASFQAAEALDNEQEENNYYAKGSLSTGDKVKRVWRLYIPAASTGVLTIACIVCANRIGTRRAAAMAAAYTLTEKAYTEYRDKVIERIGENKERSVRDELAQEQVARTTSEVMFVGEGEVLCFDTYSGRYFKSTMETIKKAQNDTNYEILHNYYCSLGDFYQRIGLPGTEFSEEVGWNSEHQLEVLFSTVLTDDNKPCLAIRYSVQPVRRYHHFG